MVWHFVCGWAVSIRTENIKKGMKTPVKRLLLCTYANQRINCFHTAITFDSLDSTIIFSFRSFIADSILWQMRRCVHWYQCCHYHDNDSFSWRDQHPLWCDCRTWIAAKPSTYGKPNYDNDILFRLSRCVWVVAAFHPRTIRIMINDVSKINEKRNGLVSCVHRFLIREFHFFPDF